MGCPTDFFLEPGLNGDPSLDCRQIRASTHRCGGPCVAGAGDEASQPDDTGTSSLLVPLEDLPLVVKGSRVLGRSGEAYQLACVNWYGAHMEMLVNNGLNVKSLAEIAAHLAKMGAFNCVRMPYSHLVMQCTQ
eukprot:Skav215503  [mRNA]  locus=scaffold165:873649:880199:- [translate_table: standard]